MNFFKKQNQKNQIEKELPKVLYSVASASSFQTIQELFDFASETKGVLGKIFTRMSASAKNGIPIPKIISKEIKQSPSPMFSQCLELLKQGYESGSDTSELLTDLADDVSQSLDVQTKQQTITALENYTLLLSCCLLVPFILGLIFSVVQGMDFQGLAEWGFGQNASNKTNLLSAVLLANHAYLTIYALIVAFFLSNQKGNFSKLVSFAIVMVLIANTVFMLARGGL